jgi:uncharacterized membrane protein YphA (DoxX/SURF4 family)
MSLLTVILYIALAAVVTTAVMKFSTDKIKVWWLSLLQNFCGILFIFSGWVKVVDPMGTAFKMEQYFAEFEVTFSGTWLSFIAPLFPWLSSMSIGFSVFMIILEIILGLMLVLGHLPKLTAWLFFLIVLFFTVLTGFTFMTGYVPSGSNFFQFSEWGPYVETNMRVTDCGCFGDFIKIKPKTSFLKDVFLMVPAILFLFYSRRFHTLGTDGIRHMSSAVATFLLFLYALLNFHWNEPHIDFRPFREGVNIREQKAAEEEALSNVDMTMVIQNNSSGEIVKISQEEYMANFKNYPKEEWTFLDPIVGEPAVPQTKISEWMVEDMEGYEVGEELLEFEGYSLVFVCHKFKGFSATSMVINYDTTFVMDTVTLEDGSLEINPLVKEITEEKEAVETWSWDATYLNWFTEKLKPMSEAAISADIKVYAIVGGATNEAIEQFKAASGLNISFYKADDILLKTIQRSNPGIYLMKDGTMIKKWHIKRVPAFEVIESNYLNMK